MRLTHPLYLYLNRSSPFTRLTVESLSSLWPLDFCFGPVGDNGHKPKPVHNGNNQASIEGKAKSLIVIYQPAEVI